ncbi:hypothetical protein H2198_007482 [Neophaeococcomyces mojaviensis]|uniref:Uncharacterized protein n=1 Tax=Neophaeococcomyces mojaviensis TaxID=3383035 RepID=A0ACC2ZZW4_9EURO|nr:hypothetical protein H2198_007482 [Knufia sp. JES_112]
MELRHHELLGESDIFEVLDSWINEKSDIFLPFDLESAYSAAFVLVMASSIHRKLLPPENWQSNVISILEYMAEKGNVLAGLRKSEVEELAHMLKDLGRNHHGHVSQNTQNAARFPPTTPSIADHASLPSLGDPFFDEWIADNGLSGAQIMDLADALDPEVCDDFMA